MLRERIKSADGVSALEFGLVLPVLMTILLGIVDYGHVYFLHLTMTNAAREGARAGAVRSAEEAVPAALAAAETYLASAGITTASVAVPSPPTEAAPALEVDITLPYEPLVGLVPTPDELHASATMRWELASPEP